LAAGFAASVRTLAEGKIGADTAAWTRVIQGHSQDRRHGKHQLRLRWAQYDLQGSRNLGASGTVKVGQRWALVGGLRAASNTDPVTRLYDRRKRRPEYSPTFHVKYQIL